MKIPDWNRSALLGCSAFLFASGAWGQTTTPLAWDATKNFSYLIDNVSVTAASSNSWTVKVVFSVANPKPTASFLGPYWDIKTASPFTTTGSSLRVLVGWDATEHTNTNSLGKLDSVTTAGAGAALPVSINALTALACTGTVCGSLGSGHFYVTTTVSPLPVTVTSGIVAIEGRPVCPLTGPALPGCPLTAGVATAANIPVKSVVKTFAFTGVAVERRKIVDIANCKNCHDDRMHGNTVVPRLSLHGANRNEELTLCVVCHNPNQTDVPYRTSGEEVSVDFKRMIHGIHAGGFRKTPLVIVGRNGVLNDFSTVRFPSELSNCLMCHINVNGKGTYELPISSKALGSTINTGSTYSAASHLVDVDPSNNLRITPTAAACSACHDSSEVRNHMIKTGGASFSTTISSAVTERCVNCHGAGKSEDVRKVHEISGSSSSGRSSDR